MKNIFYAVCVCLGLAVAAIAAGTIETNGIFGGLKLGGTQNIISDNGTAPTYNGGAWPGGGGGSDLWTNSAGTVQLIDETFQIQPGASVVVSNTVGLVLYAGGDDVNTDLGVYIPPTIDTSNQGLLDADVFGFGAFYQGSISNSVTVSSHGVYSGLQTILSDSRNVNLFGTFAGANATLSGVQFLSLYGDEAGHGIVISEGSHHISGFGTDALFQETISGGSQYIEGMGYGALGVGTVTNSTRIWAHGPNSFAGVYFEGCDDIGGLGYNIGNSASLTNKHHMVFLGSGAMATNSNDFVFGDSAYNYFFPGASWHADAPISAVNTNRWALGGYVSGSKIAAKVDGTNYNLLTDFQGAGAIGETISSKVASGSAGGISNGSGTNVTSISLTAGTWLVSGNVNFSANTATVTGTSAGITTTTGTVPTDGTEVFSGVQVTLLSETDSVTLPTKVLVLGSPTSVFLVGKCSFSAGTVKAFGSISATRIN